jgi:hypothetical protein
LAAEDGNLPLSVLLLGAGAVCAFLAMRPWPQASGQPIKPGAYVVDVLRGEPPPAGPEAFSSTEVDLTETGIATLVGIWAASKVASGLGGFLNGIMGALGLRGGGGGGEGEAPPAEEVPDVM